MDPDLVPLMVQENYVHFSAAEDIDKLAKATDLMSMADIGNKQVSLFSERSCYGSRVRFFPLCADVSSVPARFPCLVEGIKPMGPHADHCIA
mmetsp:Transcript_7087/g.31341  ORF Transcript_7087/g.31341 Transcript_7087/m.31341 type:complete len:92 (+) Transcript_7087:1675-1950(+)